MTKVFYVPGSRYAYDEVIDLGGRKVGKWSKRTIEDCRTEHPDIVCIERDECTARITQLVLLAPQEITEAAFIEMRSAHPPCAWERQPECESFHVAAFDVFDITGIYVRIGERYFRMKDRYTMPHCERVLRIKEAFPDID